MSVLEELKTDYNCADALVNILIDRATGFTASQPANIVATTRATGTVSIFADPDSLPPHLSDLVTSASEAFWHSVVDYSAGLPDTAHAAYDEVKDWARSLIPCDPISAVLRMPILLSTPTIADMVLADMQTRVELALDAVAPRVCLNDAPRSVFAVTNTGYVFLQKRAGFVPAPVRCPALFRISPNYAFHYMGIDGEFRWYLFPLGSSYNGRFRLVRVVKSTTTVYQSEPYAKQKYSAVRSSAVTVFSPSRKRLVVVAHPAVPLQHVMLFVPSPALALRRDMTGMASEAHRALGSEITTRVESQLGGLPPLNPSSNPRDPDPPGVDGGCADASRPLIPVVIPCAFHRTAPRSPRLSKFIEVDIDPSESPSSHTEASSDGDAPPPPSSFNGALLSLVSDLGLMGQMACGASPSRPPGLITPALSGVSSATQSLAESLAKGDDTAFAEADSPPPSPPLGVDTTNDSDVDDDADVGGPTSDEIPIAQQDEQARIEHRSCHARFVAHPPCEQHRRCDERADGGGIAPALVAALDDREDERAQAGHRQQRTDGIEGIVVGIIALM